LNCRAELPWCVWWKNFFYFPFIFYLSIFRGGLVAAPLNELAGLQEVGVRILPQRCKYGD
jgi:hypothetical protein